MRVGCRASRPPRRTRSRLCANPDPNSFRAVTEGLIRAGCAVVDVGLAPTPTISLAVEHHRAGGGIANTAEVTIPSKMERTEVHRRGRDFSGRSRRCARGRPRSRGRPPSHRPRAVTSRSMAGRLGGTWAWYSASRCSIYRESAGADSGLRWTPCGGPAARSCPRCSSSLAARSRASTSRRTACSRGPRARPGASPGARGTGPTHGSGRRTGS